MNIYYIRAAIQAALGINISLEDTKLALIAEGMVSKRDADKLIFVGYGDYYDSYTPTVIYDDVDLPPVLDDDTEQAVTVALSDL